MGDMDERDNDGLPTPWALACAALSDHGCECDDDEPGTCLGCRCEAAMRAERARAERAERAFRMLRAALEDLERRTGVLRCATDREETRNSRLSENREDRRGGKEGDRDGN